MGRGLERRHLTQSGDRDDDRPRVCRARWLAKWIDGLGCQEVTVRTDGEPSICELIRRVPELRSEGTTTVDEISPPGDSASNGITERAILTVGSLVRATKAVVEENALEGRNAGPRQRRGWYTTLLK